MNDWNHNTAYYGWIQKKTAHCGRILDVGCGDGSLAFLLADEKKAVVGIDSDPGCIRTATEQCSSAQVRFVCTDFASYVPQERFDAVTFAASIHHMNMRAALEKAKSVLRPGGVLLIVGLAEPSGAIDWLVEALRVVPSALISKLRRMSSCEAKHIPVSYAYPPMDEVRSTVRDLLPGSKIRYGLHYRYLLEWQNEQVLFASGE